MIETSIYGKIPDMSHAKMPFPRCHRHVSGLFEGLVHQLLIVGNRQIGGYWRKDLMAHRDVAGQDRYPRWRANWVGIPPVHFEPVFRKLVNVWRRHLASMVTDIAPSLIVSHKDQDVRLCIARGGGRA